MKIIGYARVSTAEQNLSLQLQALERAGCDRIYTDQGVSGAIHQRAGLERALRSLRAGDKLVVWRLDRLGRSLDHLLRTIEALGRRDVGFHSLCELIDTTSSGGRLVFHMMAALAEFERALISERTKAGMAAARQSGVRIGRAPALSEKQVAEAWYLVCGQGQHLKSVAGLYGVHPRTLSRRFAMMQICDEGGASCHEPSCTRFQGESTC